METTNLELERKKASHVFQYLMERKNDVKSDDPFELLRSMNDVMMCYEPRKSNKSIDINNEPSQYDPQQPLNASASKWSKAKKSSKSFYSTGFSSHKNKSNLNASQTMNADLLDSKKSIEPEKLPGIQNSK
jgi:hypothetical protein